MSVFFISDLHLCHKNALRFFPQRSRFKTTRELGDYLIDKWNNVVTKEDKVIVLGDIALNLNYEGMVDEANDILSSLNGIKVCVKGNHDVGPMKRELIGNHFIESLGCYEYKDAVCTHIPVHPQQLFGSPDTRVYKKWKWNIHGHLHTFEVEPYDPRYINVSCEMLDFTPRTYEDLVEERMLLTNEEHLH